MHINGELKPRRKGEAEKIGELMFDSFKYCFGKDSTEKWVKMFGHKRFDMLKQEQKEDYNVNISKNFEDNCIRVFTKLTLEYIEQCKDEHKKQQKAKSDEEKEYQKKHGVKRKKGE